MMLNGVALMPKFSSLVNKVIDGTKEVSKGVEQGSAITNTMKQVVHVASGKFVIDALAVVPPVNYGLTLFGNAVESSTKFVAEPLVSASFSYAVRKMVRNAATSYCTKPLRGTIVNRNILLFQRFPEYTITLLKLNHFTLTRPH